MRLIYTFVLLLLLSLPAFPQLNGVYNVGAGQTFASIKAVCDSINSGGISGNCTFYITSDITEPANFGLGRNTGSYTITFKPSADADRVITFTSTADNTGFSGHFVIGSSNPLVTTSDANTIGTSNVTIDGYADGGTTKRLKFTNASASAANARLITVAGDCQNTVIKNCIFENNSTSTTSPVCIVAVVRKGTAIDYAPTNLTIENNTMTALGSVAGMGMRITNSGTPTSRVTGFIFRNNIVTAKRRLLEINYATGGEIYNNEFTTNQTGAAGTVSYGLWTSTGIGGTFNIYNNKFLESLTEETGAFGHRVVSLASTGTYNIYNNMFSGMKKTKASSAALNLTYLFYSGVSGKIYHNTFYMPALANATSTGYYSAIQLSGNTAEIVNNIFICDEPTFANVYFISAIPTPTTDYNVMYHRQVNAGAKYVSTYTTLAAYQGANPTKDVHSKSVNVTFAGATNLHITVPDMNLVGTTGLGISTDIDGDTRSGSYPYIGADESTSYPLPVELTAFSADVKNGSAVLNWKTATEVNAFAFVVERATVTSTDLQWTEIGRVMAAGNANSSRDYSFRDANTLPGKMAYRLRMVDNDGTYKYSKTVEVDVTVPKEFTVSQNYPNPFNPATRIDFSLPQDAQIQLEIFAISGEKVATVTNGNFAAGTHAVTVNMQSLGLGSGVYLYRVQAVSVSGERFVQTKKMVMLK